MEKLNEWWSSLTVANKEKVATKARDKGGMKVDDVNYPGCTQWWNNASKEDKITIYEHCTNDHGMVVEEWSEGKSMSY